MLCHIVWVCCYAVGGWAEHYSPFPDLLTHVFCHEWHCFKQIISSTMKVSQTTVPHFFVNIVWGNGSSVGVHFLALLPIFHSRDYHFCPIWRDQAGKCCQEPDGLCFWEHIIRNINYCHALLDVWSTFSSVMLSVADSTIILSPF